MKAESIIAFGLAVFVIAFVIGDVAGRRAERHRRHELRRSRRTRERIERYGVH